jgi:hypothetical protein
MNFILIDHEWTRDDVRIDVDMDGSEIGWTCTPNPPAGDGWVICNTSDDYWTRWRRIRLGRPAVTFNNNGSRG